MEEEIRESYLYYSTAKKLWDVLTVAYSDLENSAQLFELWNKARNLCQGDLEVTYYYNSLQKLWQEIDMFVQINCDTPKDAENNKKQVEN